MKRFFLLVIVFASHAAFGAEALWLLAADEWARPRDGRSVAQMQPLPQVLSNWSKDSTQTLLIRYPGGEEGLLWAYELRSWLVALGVPLHNQELVAGSRQADQIEIELVTR